MVETLRRHPLVGELLAEFAGTFILIVIGLGVVAQVVASGTGDYNSIAWAWGFAVTLGVYTAARVSGAHLNPAVTLALAVFRGFSWVKVMPYVGVQVAAAFLAALVVRWNYSEAIAAADPGTTAATQTIFSTLPAEGLDVISDDETRTFRLREPVVEVQGSHVLVVDQHVDVLPSFFEEAGPGRVLGRVEHREVGVRVGERGHDQAQAELARADVDVVGLGRRREGPRTLRGD